MTYQDKHDRHEIYIARVATHLFNQHSLQLDVAYKAARLILLDTDEIKSMAQMNALIAEINRAIKPVLTESMATVSADLDELATHEAAFYRKLFNDVNTVTLALPAAAKTVSHVNNTLMTLASGKSVRSDVWTRYVAKNVSGNAELYSAAIKNGYRNSESMSQIVKRLRDTNNGLVKSSARTLITTATSHFANEARENLMLNNKVLVPNKYFSATFDSSTTAGCRMFDGQVFAVEDPNAPILPRHFNCRSKWLYLLKGQTEPVGTKQAVGGKKGKAAEEAFDKKQSKTDKRVIYKGKADANMFKAGQISGGTSMDKWMHGQPEWFIKSSLGKYKADAFMSGKASLKDFSDATGRSLTVKELIASGV